MARRARLLSTMELAQSLGVNANRHGVDLLRRPRTTPILLGGRFYDQLLIADPPVNPFGFVLSNRVVGMVGNQ